MFRYLNNKIWTIITAQAVAGLLILQIITPTIVFGMTENTEEQTANETAEIIEAVVEVVSGPEEEIEDESEDQSTQTQSNETENTGTTTIDTGDAVAGLDVKNEINSNNLETNKSASSSEVVDSNEETDVTSQNATATTSSSSAAISPNPDTLAIHASNTATSSTNATTTASTGDNQASAGNVTINTGQAVAYTDVLNVVNTNIVNSAGLIKFVNSTLGYENFDLRSDFDLAYNQFNTSQSTDSCSLSSCNNANTFVDTDNTATIENNITVKATSGNNSATGTATISTGDTYASANIINVANTNITDSNYLLLVFNNFSDFAGDIVLPNSSFFNNLITKAPPATNLNLNIDNEANISNTLETTADSGNNQATGDNTSINTGNNYADSSVTNTVNQNIIGGGSFSMLIRVHGDWSGSITGLPAGLSWRETDQGIEIVSSSQSSGQTSSTNLNQTTSNKAVINNNVKVFALSGDNKASGDNSSISTGNSYANSSVLNIANTNVIGSNWSNMIFNIYGNWSGNLSFGQSNLWLGVSASSPDSPIMPGSMVTYTYTVFNQGDSVASDVTLENIFENKALDFQSNSPLSTSTNSNLWEIGDIGAKETREFSYTALVSNALDRNAVSAIPLTSRVRSTQTDADFSDNEEIVTIYVGEKPEESNSTRSTFPANFTIEKTANRDYAQPGDVVDYTIKLFNHGGQLYDALLTDYLENTAGEIIQEQTWPLGEIKNWETITITYSLEFESSMATGTYQNHAQLVGFHGSRKTKYQSPFESHISTHTLNLGVEPRGRVLGISSSICTPYLTEYLRYGENNNFVEVIKLQTFLNTHLNAKLAINGTFDVATELAVRDFQKLYQDEVLSPWGLEKDSGFVYYTTQKKINEIMCGNTEQFPLTLKQQQEIAIFKDLMRQQNHVAIETNNIPPALPKNENPPVILSQNNRPAEKVDSHKNLTNDPAEPASVTIDKAPGVWSKVKSWWQNFTKNRTIALR